MSRRNRKNNNGGSTKIDLGLEELLAAVNGNKSDPSDLSAEAAPKDSALEQPVEIENQVRNLYQDYFTKADWAELEKFCLRNLKDGFNLEAKLWWIRSVCQSGALPRFLLAAPFEEAVAFAKNNDSDSNLFSDLIAAISNELSGTIQSISSKVVSDSVIEEKVETSTLLRDPNIPIKSSDFDENAALLPVQANNRNHILRSRQVQLSVLVLAAILLSTAIYFLKMQSDQRKFRASLALLSQPKEVDSQESTDATVISSADKIDPNREPQEAVAAGSNAKAVLDKLRQEQKVLEDGEQGVEPEVEQEDSSSKNKNGELRIDDILDMVNEDPEPVGSNATQVAADSDNSETEKLKAQPEFDKSDQIIEIDLSGPIEPPQISNVMGLEVSGKSVAQVQPGLIESFPMAGYKGGPQKTATPLTVTRAGSVYTNTSPYAVEIEVLQPGDKVWLLERQGIWLKIASREGEVGFIDAQLVS